MNRVNHLLENPTELLSLLHLTDMESAIIYLAGSLLEGFGNLRSDIDVYVLCKDEELETLRSAMAAIDGSFLLTAECIIRNITIRESRFDIEYWSRSKFTDLVGKISNLDFNTSDYIDRLSKEEFDVLHRLKYGKPLHNKQQFIELYQSVNFENLKYYKIVTQSEIYTGIVEDVQGAYLSKDFGSAFFMARNLIDIVMTGYLAGKGETNPGNKWLFRKLIRYEERCRELGEEIHLSEEYLRLQTHEYSLDTVQKYIKEVLGYCQKLNLESQNMLRAKQMEGILR
ncbi:putative nucleotidyltransferase [Paenibacillus sp. PastF-1]|nr:putative nucleotidyltransferase [Paenibacillus sp. PastF-1]